MAPQNFQQVYDEVESQCKTATDGQNGTETTLEDWMHAGNWQEMTSAEIAAEWDALSDDHN